MNPLRDGSRTRWLAMKGFSSSLPPLQDLSWRNNTRSRLADCAFTGQVSNLLARGARFQLIASSLPGLALAQYNPLAIHELAANEPPSKCFGVHACKCRAWCASGRQRARPGYSSVNCDKALAWQAAPRVGRGQRSPR